MDKKLIGELIGLARTTDGNEHLINAAATAIIIECLRDDAHADSDMLLSRIEQVKRQMVPDCYLCLSPCGKNSAYDIDDLQKETPAVRNLKLRILDALMRFARTGRAINREEESLLYRSLILLGIDEPSEEILFSYQSQIHGLL